jgi:hypothetical protein
MKKKTIVQIKSRNKDPGEKKQRNTKKYEMTKEKKK